MNTLPGCTHLWICAEVRARWRAAAAQRRRLV